MLDTEFRLLMEQKQAEEEALRVWAGNVVGAAGEVCAALAVFHLWRWWGLLLLLGLSLARAR